MEQNKNKTLEIGNEFYTVLYSYGNSLHNIIVSETNLDCAKFKIMHFLTTFECGRINKEVLAKVSNFLIEDVKFIAPNNTYQLNLLDVNICLTILKTREMLFTNYNVI